ncbi:MAG: 23S rRNA (guanosine(2251)-2'-O)-methyltransferase RlmB [Bacteroidales bacterium]|nr:23S rRNA (guanosine(2251)-2'-O)-methyltransferase RlmB [Bacteroidales bacterium]
MKKENQIYGLRPVIEAIKSGKEIDKILFQKGLKGTIYNELRTLAFNKNIAIQFVPVEKLNRITRKNHQGIVAYISLINYYNIEDILPMVYEKGEIPLFLILDRITDVRNIGAISRTAECAGVQAIIIPDKGSAQINADAIKSSAGALHLVNIVKSRNLKNTIKYLKDNGIQIVACTEKSDDYYYSTDFTIPTAIIMGSEENGISNDLLNISDCKVKIPVKGEIESLNVSVASAVIVYEAVKQRINSKIFK